MDQIPTSVPAIELEHVTFRYFEHGKHNVLEDASIRIPQGKITVIAGNSGCGKSTMAAVADGLYPENGGILSSGQVRLFGQPAGEMSPAARSRYLSMMFQNPDLQFCMDTLRKELRFCLENICVPVEKMDEEVERWAGKMDMTPFLDRKLYTLSGGEKQKAALTCLFLLGSKAILMDEPFANIDEDGAREIVQWIVRQNREQGLTVAAIDHRLDYWLPAADEIIVMGKGGKILERGISRENFESHRSLFDREGLYYPGRYEQKVQEEGAEVPALVLEKASVKGLLDEACAVIPKGRITALLGPSGCGKTTLFYTLLGKGAYGGSIKADFGGGLKEISSVRPKERFLHMGIVFQNPGNQFITQNVYQEVEESYRRWQPQKDEKEQKEQVEEQLRSYGLGQYRKYSPYMLSQGQQRRLAVLASLAGNQEFLLLDEPTYGQDYRSTMAIMEELQEKVRRDGLTVLMATHDRALAHAVSSVIYEVKDRKLVRVSSDEQEKGGQNGAEN